MTTERTALVVDPDKKLAAAVRAILSSEGFDVTVVHDGMDAFSHCENQIPDLLLAEGLVPRLNGLELIKKVRQLPNGGFVTVVLMSAVYTGKKFQSQIDEAGVDHVLSKPISPEELIDRLRSLQLKKIPEPEVSDEATDIPTSGDLKDHPFIQVVGSLHRKKESGTLRLESENIKKLVTFEAGEPKFVVSNLEKECLGQLLVRKGRLTPEECKRSLDMMAETKTRQGETLIRLGLLEPYELDEALKQQAREKFCEIFAWKQGKFIFVPGKVFKKELTPIDLTIPQLCLRGVKEHFSLSQLQEELGPHLQRKAKLREKSFFSLDDFKLAAWDLRIVRELRDQKSLAEILSKQLARDVDVFHLFYCFKMLGVIEVEIPKAAETSEKKNGSAEAGKSSIDYSKMTPFQILNVDELSSDEQIREAFDTEMHRTKSKGEDPEKIKALKSAYETISSFQGRRDYLVRIYEEEDRLLPGAREIFESKEFLEIGKRFVEKKDYTRALKIFEDGVRLFPESGVLFGYLGFVMVQMSYLPQFEKGADREKGRKITIKGTRLSPLEADVHYLMGRIFVLDKDYDTAEKALNKALRLDPTHKSAASELRVVQMRLEKQKNTSFIKWKR